MSSLDDDLEPFMDERISHNIGTFHKSKKWKNLYNQFSHTYENLSNNIGQITKKDLEKLHSTFNNLSVQEQYLIYKIGFVDGICLREQLGISQRR